MAISRRATLVCVTFLLCFTALGAKTPSIQAADEQCFPPTKQCLSGHFRLYWERNGGLPVFGYPITPVRDEQNWDTGKSYRVQWLERNRFEAHPENVAPYDTLLGRLGDDRLRQLGRNWQAEPHEDGPQQGCRWFAETHLSVCDQGNGQGFKTYWETHGLQDPALDAYQRSLALFGLPLTKPQVETNSSGDAVLTQWFERARFEWHPDKPVEFKVLLGRLGDEVLHGGTSISRPGGHITYVSDGDLFRMNTDGSGQTRLTTTGAVPFEEAEYSVSPLGDRIAYRVDSRLFVSNADGSGQRLVVSDTTELEPLARFSPTWSPDGSYLAYALDGDIYATRVDGGPSVQITTGAHVDQISCLSWARSGYLAFRTPMMHTFKFVVVRSDGSDMHGVGAGLCPTLSPSGDRITYLNGDGGLWIMNADGSDAHALTSGRSFVPGLWSPDGKSILTVGYDGSNAGQRDIFVIDAATGAMQQLTTVPGIDAMPSWSPDGSFITFVSNRTNRYGIYVMSRDGRDQTLLVTPDESTAPQWSPR